jgi:hypothetical protein
MSEAVAERKVPRGALLGAAALIGFSVIVAGLGRLTGVGTVRTDYATAVKTASFRFEDRSDGGISVIAPQPAFVIAKWSDGHTTIEDPATGRRVDLAAFGAANMKAFEHVVALRGVRP